MRLCEYAIAAKIGGSLTDEAVHFDPADCPNAYLRQNIYVEKINWLRAIGKIQKAKETQKQYDIIRKEVENHIPQQYLTAFRNHPTLSMA